MITMKACNVFRLYHAYEVRLRSPPGRSGLLQASDLDLKRDHESNILSNIRIKMVKLLMNAAYFTTLVSSKIDLECPPLKLLETRSTSTLKRGYTMIHNKL
jgi:hypothetical protein